jgi:hypothetical protein
VVIVLWPFFNWWWLTRNKDRLDDKLFIEKFGTMLQDVRDKRPITFLYTSFFSARRFLVVMCFLFFLEDIFALYVSLLVVQTLEVAYLTTAWPHYEAHQNITEIINELLTILVVYCMALLHQTDSEDI